MILRKLLLCWWGACGMVQRGDATHVWGECPRCGKVAGLISREAIRRYIDAQERQREFDRKHEAALQTRERRT